MLAIVGIALAVYLAIDTNKALNQYQKTFLCLACGATFVPGQGTLAKPKNSKRGLIIAGWLITAVLVLILAIPAAFRPPSAEQRRENGKKLHDAIGTICNNEFLTSEEKQQRIKAFDVGTCAESQVDYLRDLVKRALEVLEPRKSYESSCQKTLKFHYAYERPPADVAAKGEPTTWRVKVNSIQVSLSNNHWNKLRHWDILNGYTGPKPGIAVAIVDKDGQHYNPYVDIGNAPGPQGEAARKFSITRSFEMYLQANSGAIRIAIYDTVPTNTGPWTGVYWPVSDFKSSGNCSHVWNQGDFRDDTQVSVSWTSD